MSSLAALTTVSGAARLDASVTVTDASVSGVAAGPPKTANAV